MGCCCQAADRSIEVSCGISETRGITGNKRHNSFKLDHFWWVQWVSTLKWISIVLKRCLIPWLEDTSPSVDPPMETDTEVTSLLDGCGQTNLWTAESRQGKRPWMTINNRIDPFWDFARCWASANLPAARIFAGVQHRGTPKSSSCRRFSCQQAVHKEVYP